jgi:hypothetical protein
MHLVATNIAYLWGLAPLYCSICCHPIHRGAIGNFAICMSFVPRTGRELMSYLNALGGCAHDFLVYNASGHVNKAEGPGSCTCRTSPVCAISAPFVMVRR